MELGALKETEEGMEKLDWIASNMDAETVEQRLNPMKKSLGNFLSRKKTYQSLSLGVGAPDFAAPTAEGEVLSLKPIVSRNKVTLVDFWASWCAPCKRNFIYLKELYGEYHDSGFEIVGVSKDSSVEDWKNGISENELPWINLGDISENIGPVSTLYGINFIPRTYVLNSDMEILGKDLDEEELESLVWTILSGNT